MEWKQSICSRRNYTDYKNTDSHRKNIPLGSFLVSLVDTGKKINVFSLTFYPNLFLRWGILILKKQTFNMSSFFFHFPSFKGCGVLGAKSTLFKNTVSIKHISPGYSCISLGDTENETNVWMLNCFKHIKKYFCFS